MEIEYIRRGGRNCLSMRLACDECVAHEVMMLKNNAPGMLLPVSLRLRDDEQIIDYDISGWTDISDYFEKRRMDEGDVKTLIKSIAECALLLDDHLLGRDGLVLIPEYIFTEPGVETKAFVYNPGKRESFEENLKGLLKFVLDHIDYRNREVNEMAYTLFSMAGPDAGIEKMAEYVSGHTAHIYSEGAASEDDAGYEEVPAQKKENRKRGLFGLFKSRSRAALKEKLIEGSPRMLIGMVPQPEGKRFTTEELKGAAPEPRFVLSSMDENGGEDFIVSASPFLVGKQQDMVDVVIQAESVSRLHAKLITEGGRLYVQDMNSRNGTFVEGVRINGRQRRELPDGGVVAFADRRYMLKVY